MKKLTLLLIAVICGISSLAQNWRIDNAPITAFSPAEELKIAIDETNGHQFVAYRDDNSSIVVKFKNPQTGIWNEIFNASGNLGPSNYKFPNIIAHNGEVILSFYKAIGSPNDKIIIMKGTNQTGSFNHLTGAEIDHGIGFDLTSMDMNETTDFDNIFIASMATSSSPIIGVGKISVSTSSYNSFGTISPPGNVANNPDSVQIHANNSEVFVALDYNDGGTEKFTVYKSSTGLGAFTSHIDLPINVSQFKLAGVANDEPFLTYFQDDKIVMNKLNPSGYDFIAQQSGLTNIKFLSLDTDENNDAVVAFSNVALINLQTFSVSGGSFNIMPSIPNDINNNGSAPYNTMDFKYSAVSKRFFLGAGSIGDVTQSKMIRTNILPDTINVTKKTYCTGTEPNDTLIHLQLTDGNGDSTYIYSVTSSNQTVIPDNKLSISDLVYTLGNPLRDFVISVDSVGVPGTIDITVRFTDGIDTNVQIIPVTVDSPPSLSFTNDPTNICIENTGFDLNTLALPNLSGGTWTNGNIFNPVDKGGVGSYSEEYTYTSPSGCVVSASINVVVNELPTITFGNNDLDICIDGGSVSLGALSSPTSGGTFIDGDNFDPVAAGVGTHFQTYQLTDGNGCVNNQDLTVNVIQAVFNFSQASTAVCENSDIVDVNNFIGPAEQGGSFSPNNIFDPSISGAGTFPIDYTYTDPLGCVTTETFNVIVNQLPNISFNNASIEVCGNGEIIDLRDNLNGTTGGMFISNQDNYFIPNQHPAGTSVTQTYQLIDQATGCINEANFDILLYEYPELTSSITNSNCGNNNGSVDLSITSPNGTATVYWSNGATTEDIADLMPGTYYANVTDPNGCIATEQVDIQSNGLSLTANITNASCFGSNDGSIDLTATGNGPFLYLWATADSTEDVSNLSAGTYFVTVTDANGCISTANYAVEQPGAIVVETQVTDASCQTANGEISVVNTFGGDETYTYNWSNGLPNAAIQSNLDPGAYELQVADGNGCLSPIYNLQVNGVDAPQLYGIVTNTACNQDNGAIDLFHNVDAGAIQSINWSNGATTEDIADLSPGTYTAEVIDTAGCSSFYSGVVEIVAPLQNDICIVTVDSATTTNLVVWERTQTTGISHYNIYRENAQAGEYVKIDEVDADSLTEYVDLAASPSVRSWRYKITATNECDVEGPQSLHHKTIHIVFEENGGTVDVNWDEYEGFDFSTYVVGRIDAQNPEWVLVSQVNVGDPLTITDTPPVTDGLDYRVFVNTSTCTSTKANDYNTSRSNRSSGVFSPGDVGDDAQIGLTELELNYDINIYPNPTENELIVQVENGVQVENIEVRSANGQIVQTLNSKLNLTTLQLNNLETGIYFVVVTTNEGKSLHKVIKK